MLDTVLRDVFEAKFLAQIQDPTAAIPVKIFPQAKAKEPANDALSKFAELYLSHKKVGTLVKEKHTGKIVTEWGKQIAEASDKPELVDMSHSISSFMTVKDEEELVRVRELALVFRISDACI